MRQVLVQRIGEERGESLSVCLSALSYPLLLTHPVSCFIFLKHSSP